MGIKRTNASAGLFKGSEDISEERTGISVSANAPLQLLANLIVVALPASEEMIPVKPLINGGSKEFHYFVSRQQISILGTTHEGNSNRVPCSAISGTVGSDKNIQLAPVLVQNEINFFLVSIKGLDPRSWLRGPAPLIFLSKA